MVMMLKTLDKVEILPKEAPAEFPPPIFAASASILVLWCSYGALFEGTLVESYI
jgi:hypothetical protein